MGTVRIGGDPEQYMDPPSITKSDSPGEGAGSFIASILDAIGVHRQVAKGPKESEGGKGKKKAGQPQDQLVGLASDGPVQTALPVLDSATSLFAAPNQQPLTAFGQKWMDSVAPIMTIDPGASTAKRM